MKTLSALFASSLLLLSSVMACAKDFEGVLRIKIGAGGEKSQEADYSLKSGFMRLDMAAEGHTVAIIADLNKMEALMLMPSERMCMVMSLKSATAKAAQSADDATIEDTGVTEKILGYTCTKYLVKAKRGDEITELWATTELGAFVSFSTLSQMGNPRSKATASWENVLKGKNIFPLRVVVRKADGQIASQMDILSITPKALPDSLFQVPAGYERMDMGGMMQGMMGGGR